MEEEDFKCPHCNNDVAKSSWGEYSRTCRRKAIGSIFRSADVSECEINAKIKANDIFVENGFIYMKQ